MLSNNNNLLLPTDRRAVFGGERSTHGPVPAIARVVHGASGRIISAVMKKTFVSTTSLTQAIIVNEPVPGRSVVRDKVSAELSTRTAARAGPALSINNAPAIIKVNKKRR